MVVGWQFCRWCRGCESDPFELLSHGAPVTYSTAANSNLMKNSIAREGGLNGVERACSPIDGAVNTKSGETLSATAVEPMTPLHAGSRPRDPTPHKIHALDTTMPNHWPPRPLLTWRWSSPCTGAVDSYRSAHPIVRAGRGARIAEGGDGVHASEREAARRRGWVLAQNELGFRGRPPPPFCTRRHETRAVRSPSNGTNSRQYHGPRVQIGVSIT